MKSWQEYVAFTATTALPAASNPEYLRLGLLEETDEFLSAYFAYCAAQYGWRKRTLRGDDEATIAAKRAEADRHRQKAIEELGDVCWYTARAWSEDAPRQIGKCAVKNIVRSIDIISDRDATADAYSFGFSGVCIIEQGLGLMDVSLETVLTANVAKLTARNEAGTIKGHGDR
jgi:hypothetical protein